MESVLRRDRLLVALGLALVTAAAWLWTLSGAALPMGAGADSAADAGRMADAAMAVASWSAGHAALMLAMWWVMMVAMMLPSAAPFLLLATSIHRRKGAGGRSTLPTSLLASGYLLVWGGFSLLATAAQWGLHSAGALSAGGMAIGPALGGTVLVGAGLYQLTPVKRACLRTCRSPMGFLVAHWRPGPAGALRMGMLHGAYCVGCCWALMALLFVGGIMNPLWIGGIALFVMLEKLAPGGERLRRAAGVALLAGGAWMWLVALP